LPAQYKKAAQAASGKLCRFLPQAKLFLLATRCFRQVGQAGHLPSFTPSLFICSPHIQLTAHIRVAEEAMVFESKSLAHFGHVFQPSSSKGQ
jgi:hypothetical protein